MPQGKWFCLLFVPCQSTCRNPTLREVWGHHSHSRKWDLRVLRDSWKLKVRFQGSKHLALRWSLYRGKVLKCRCPKWPCMSHLDICNTSYDRKKGRESNWQFDSRPLKVENWPDPSACRKSVTRRWKVLKESYKFASDLIPIRGLSKELWAAKVSGVQTWRAPKSRGETKLKVSQSQVAESRLGSTLPASNSRKG
jgi:hypothetical protein